MKKKIVMIGGGTGSFVVLSGLKKFSVELSAVVSVTDSGGSTGRLRTEFGFLPVGDIRQCLAALAVENGNDYIRKLLLYRFHKGKGLKGHNLGNLILTALTDLMGSEPKAIEKASQIFRLQGKVIPVTTSNIQLGAEYEDGEVVIGEHQIDEPAFGGGKKIVRLFTKPKAEVYKGVLKILKKVDLIVLGPGDLYTSILPNLIIKGMAEAIKKSSAKVVYVVNLMTRYSQTHQYSAQDHVDKIEEKIGDNIDFVLVNNKKIPDEMQRIYQKEKGFPVKDDLNSSRYKVIRDNFLTSKKWVKPKGDRLQRSYLRHDSSKLAETIIGLI